MDSIDNRYVLLEELGRGGMGAVYRASDRLTGQPVAIKRVRVTAAGDDRRGPKTAASASEIGAPVDAVTRPATWTP